MTYFVILIRYTESTHYCIFGDRKRYEYELERQMERRMGRNREYEFARTICSHRNLRHRQQSQ